MESLKSLRLEDGTGMESLKSPTLGDCGDLAWKIWLRLQLKQLFRCKLVCKAWNSIICSPSFKAEYCRALSADAGFFRTGMLSRYDDSDPSRIPMSYFPAEDGSTTEKEFLSSIDSSRPPYPEKPFVLASSGGLLLGMRRSLVVRSQMKIGYYICCPLTEEWLTLALSPNCNQYSIDGFICHEEDNATDTTRGSERYDYQIVRILTGPEYSCSVEELDFLVTETYSSRTCQWSTDRFPVPSGLQSVPRPGHEPAVFAQGFFNWLVNYGVDFMSYNPTTRRLEVLPLPPYGDCIVTVKIGTLRTGALCCCRWEARELFLEVWVLDRCNNSISSEEIESPWVSIYQVHLDTCKGRDLFIYDVLISDVLDALIVIAEKKVRFLELIEYGLSSKKVENIRVVRGRFMHGMHKYCNYQKSKWPRRL